VLFDDDNDKDDAEWKLLYHASKTLIGTSEHEFDHSIRHNVVLNALRAAYPDRGVKPLPLACHRLAQGSPYVQWHGADSVYGDLFTNPTKKNAQGKQRGYFKLITNTRCTRLKLEPGNELKIGLVEVKDLLASRTNPTNFYIRAKTHVIAAGAVATPQILANSGFGGTRDDSTFHVIPYLGTHITEQPMAFCQVVLLRDLVNDIGKNLDQKPDWWRKAVEDHISQHGKVDPLPIPFEDPEPQVTIPASHKRPWHTQIHRDAFSYGEVGPSVDSRVVVDMRFFGMQEGVSKNRMWFEREYSDAYGMPQVTFEYLPTEKAAKEAHDMMTDMTNVASKLGGYLPGSNPQFMTPGLALHLGGTVRAGLSDEDTVANFNSQVWKFTNLYVAGNGVIPTPFGANPTLTSICLAIRSAYKISQNLAANSFPPAVPADELTPTPAEWVAWANNENDPNYPDHKRKIHKSV